MHISWDILYFSSHSADSNDFVLDHIMNYWKKYIMCCTDASQRLTWYRSWLRTLWAFCGASVNIMYPNWLAFWQKNRIEHKYNDKNIVTDYSQNVLGCDHTFEVSSQIKSPPTQSVTSFYSKWEAHNWHRESATGRNIELNTTSSPFHYHGLSMDK